MFHPILQKSNLPFKVKLVLYDIFLHFCEMKELEFTEEYANGNCNKIHSEE